MQSNLIIYALPKLMWVVGGGGGSNDFSDRS